MIIRASKIKTLDHDGDVGILNMQDVEDKTLITHIQQVDDILVEAQHIRENSDNGFTKGRGMRQIGHIPAIFFESHPEWKKNPNLILRWLKSPEGAPYRTVTKGI